MPSYIVITHIRIIIQFIAHTSTFGFLIKCKELFTSLFHHIISFKLKIHINFQHQCIRAAHTRTAAVIEHPREYISIGDGDNFIQIFVDEIEYLIHTVPSFINLGTFQRLIYNWNTIVISIVHQQTHVVPSTPCFGFCNHTFTFIFIDEVCTVYMLQEAVATADTLIEIRPEVTHITTGCSCSSTIPYLSDFTFEVSCPMHIVRHTFHVHQSHIRRSVIIRTTGPNSTRS